MKRNVVTVCGSMRFYERQREEADRLALEGNVVIECNAVKHGLTKEQESILNEIHYQKIDMSDEIFVVNVGGYIGDSTLKEIEYAKINNKKITYLE